MSEFMTLGIRNNLIANFGYSKVIKETDNGKTTGLCKERISSYTDL